ncbi:YihY/virulence factor BrkB family protein [Clostridium sp. A1-XYC3]|uniref:YihY/virulence factor BrkB family protein n=1 Tax=Clostridium tanneri TaxID=3037988 RepID=A0ABU4JPQ0_9CLOT|nr:YihY/virulence factor BrkB family protein [Clostridium sp. A1-XYC3]MDW8800101.1 YihY/virulence factor BrkB family protein [Clostridium sp. A1-XYC3]
MIERIVKDIKNLTFRFNDDDVLALASQLAYSLIFSFFPFLTFLMTLVGYSPISSGEVLVGLNKILPTNVLELVHNTVVEVVDGRNSHLLSLSLLATIWSASSGFNAVIKGLNKAYDESEDRSVFKVQFIAIMCTFGVTFIVILTMILLVFGQILGVYLAKQFGYSFMFQRFWNIVRYTVMFLTTIFIFAALYHYTPSRRLTWKEVMPGAVFSAIGLVGVSVGFAYYVNNFGNYSKVYGSIGAVIILLTWLFFLSVMIIMGGELNATLAFDREGKVKPKGKKF